MERRSGRYAWRHYLAEARRTDTLHAKKYSYVSLFGLNSLDDVRHSIFEATVAPAKALTGPDIESVEWLYEAGKALARRSRGFLGATFSMLGAGEVGKPREGIDVAFEDGAQAKNPAAHATLA